MTASMTTPSTITANVDTNTLLTITPGQPRESLRRDAELCDTLSDGIEHGFLSPRGARRIYQRRNER